MRQRSPLKLGCLVAYAKSRKTKMKLNKIKMKWNCNKNSFYYLTGVNFSLSFLCVCTPSIVSLSPSVSLSLSFFLCLSKNSRLSCQRSRNTLGEAGGVPVGGEAETRTVLHFTFLFWLGCGVCNHSLYKLPISSGNFNRSKLMITTDYTAGLRFLKTLWYHL